MKKLFFGLFLTVGFTGMSFANEIKQDDYKEDVQSNSSVVEFKDDGECYHYLVYRICIDGERYDIKHEPSVTECSAAEEEVNVTYDIVGMNC